MGRHSCRSREEKKFKLRQERHIPPRTPRRNEMKAGRGWGIFDAGFYKEFAPDGAADGPRLCPQDQSQSVIGDEGLGLF